MSSNPPDSTAPRTTLTPFEVGTVTLMCFGWAVWGSLASVGDLGPPPGFTDAVLAEMAVFEAVVASAVIGFLYLRGYAVRSLVPVMTWRDTALGAGLFLGVWLASALLLAPLVADFRAQPIAHMMRTTHVGVPMVAVFSLVNGAYEEVFLLAVLMRGVRGLGASTALGLVLLLRLLYHVYQGPVGLLAVFLIGLCFGLAWLRTGRLWVLVVAHALWDFVPLMLAGS